MKNNTLQILVLKAFRHQKPPIIVIQEKSSSTNKIIFGGLSEPSLRYLDFYKINPFQEGQTFFFTRSTVDYLDGIPPLVLQSFSRNKFLGITFFGPNGLCDFMVKLNQLIGARYLIYAAMDIPSGLYKLGIKHLHTFTEQIMKGKNLHDMVETRDIDLKNTNDYLSKISDKNNLQNPNLMMQDGCIKSKQFSIYPIENGSNKQLMSYYIVSQVEFKWDNDKLLKDKFPIQFIPELNAQRTFKIQDRVYQRDDYKLFGKEQSILMLDIQPEEIESFDIDRLLSLIAKQDSLKSILIIHMTDKTSLMTSEYEKFISKLEQIIGNKCKLVHIILDETFYTNFDVNIERDQIQLSNVDLTNKFNKLMPSLFPKIQLDRSDIAELHDQTSLTDLWKTIDVQKILSRKSLAIEIDQGEISFEKISKLGAPQIIITQQEQLQIQMAYQKIINDTPKDKSRMKITFLGTSATVPTKFINVQSFLLQVDSLKILIDCGSNTYFQLFCCFGLANIKTVLKQIKIVYISHFHGDHHLGLIQLLSKRLEINDEDIEPLKIIIPQNLGRWYKGLLNQLVEELRPRTNSNNYFNIILIEDFMRSKHQINSPGKNIQDMLDMLNSTQVSLNPFHVKHCFYSTGIQIKDLQLNESIVFSSDRDGRSNIPETKDFIKLSQDCDVLIHECTFPDNQIDRAKLVNHSSFSQAIQAGIEVNAKILVLSHYTTACQNYIQRLINKQGHFEKNIYEKQLLAISNDIKFCTILVQFLATPLMLDYLQSRTVLATDLMSVHTSDLQNMPHLSRLIAQIQPNS